MGTLFLSTFLSCHIRDFLIYTFIMWHHKHYDHNPSMHAFIIWFKSYFLYSLRDLSKQFWCPLYSTTNSILQLSFETQSFCISMCLFVFVSVKLLSYLNSLAAAFLAMKYVFTNEVSTWFIHAGIWLSLHI